jgi:hypothetical protein
MLAMRRSAGAYSMRYRSSLNSESLTAGRTASVDNPPVRVDEGNGVNGSVHLATESELKLGVAERFVIDGEPLVIRLYGDRDPERLLVNFSDAFNAVGVPLVDVPGLIKAAHALVNGVSTKVMTFSTFLIFVGMKSGEFPVA